MSAQANRVRPYRSLRAWRRAHGFSQPEAAQFLGISQSYYSKLERHEQARRQVPKAIEAVAALTGVPVAELMGIAL